MLLWCNTLSNFLRSLLIHTKQHNIHIHTITNAITTRDLVFRDSTHHTYICFSGLLYQYSSGKSLLQIHREQRKIGSRSSSSPLPLYLAPWVYTSITIMAELWKYSTRFPGKLSRLAACTLWKAQGRFYWSKNIWHIVVEVDYKLFLFWTFIDRFLLPRILFVSNGY